MNRYTIRGYKYGDTECPMSKLQDLENKIEDGDIIEVVRCKNCLYYKAVSPTCGNCHMTTYVMHPDHYCSGAKRKEQNDGKAD